MEKKSTKGWVSERAKDLKTFSSNVFSRVLNIHRKFRFPALFTLTASWLLSIPVLFYFCWFYIIPITWNWGFDPLTWRATFSVLLAFFLVVLPISLEIWAFEGINTLLTDYVVIEEAEIDKKKAELKANQREAEETLSRKDDTHLIPLIHYSRFELEAYYTTGLSQTQRSFRYSVLAMWIGFIVILGGIALYLFPIGSAEVRGSLGDIRVVTIAGGVVIEIISALFLWIYRSSINQFNYFYNRQMHLHNVLLCDRIATSMKSDDNKDATKRIIIDRVLGSTWDLKPIEAPGKKRGKNDSSKSEQPGT